MKPRTLPSKPPGRASQPQKRLPLNILFGLPDDLRAKINVVDDGRRLSFDLPGTVDIAPHLSRERFAGELIYLKLGQKESVKLGAGPLLNHIGDADICSQALELANQIVTKSGRPCFNHPSAIAATTRDGVARALSGIAGLDVPKTIRIVAPTVPQLRAAIEEGGLAYPVLVRVAGAHGGIDMIKVDTPDGLSDIDQLNRTIRSALYATEFRDFVSPDGRYRKLRIVMVGDELYLRQMLVGEKWLIHARRRISETKAEEFKRFESFEDEHVERLRPIFLEIARRLDLDFFGVDCSIAETGEVLLFEANACMGILGQTQTEANIKAAAITRIHQAVEDRLASPTTWRRFQARAHAAKV